MDMGLFEIKEFQFTPLREGRRGGREAAGTVHHISIHAPPRGATRHALSSLV